MLHVLLEGGHPFGGEGQEQAADLAEAWFVPGLAFEACEQSMAYRTARLMRGVARIWPTSPAAWEVVSSKSSSLRSRTCTSVLPTRVRW
jgi:hypothetical protein